MAVGQDLALLDVRTQAYRPLLSSETEPRAVVYDLLRETYYWLTEEGELRTHLPGKGTRPLYAGGEEREGAGCRSGAEMGAESWPATPALPFP